MYSVLLAMALCAPNMPFPLPQHGLRYTEPATVWDEAFPLGNGVLGGLVWGDGAPLRISLDRTDLWDLRPVPEFQEPAYTYATMRQWEKEGREKELLRMYDEPYNRPAPTKIPAGRIELTVDGKPGFQEGTLSLSEAEARVLWADGGQIKIWIHATEPVGFIEYRGPAALAARLAAPAFGGKTAEKKGPAIVAGELTELGYPKPVEISGPQWSAYEQEGWGGFRFAAYLTWRALDGGWLGVWSVASSHEGDQPLERARQRTEAAIQDVENLRKSHLEWWGQYWAQSSISVPNPALERQWYLETYKFGAASRAGAPPITLQGPWTADDGKLPPWKGDYHHDLNTELCYWPCYSGNRLEEGRNFLDWLWDTRGNCEEWTRRFFGMPGMNVPMTADLNNRQIGGWRQYTHSSTTAAWLAHHFYLHWKYSADRDFLEHRAYPYLESCAKFIEAVTNERDAAGRRTLPLSSSPEINDNRPQAWFPTITNYDLALIGWLLGATAEMAGELGREQDVTHWASVRAELPELALDPDGGLSVAKDFPLKESHRHFSHLMAIHPLGLLDPSQGEAAQGVINASLKRLKTLGSSQWCGYSFSWLGSLAARAGQGEKAAAALETFATAFVLRNSFHCNGDQSGQGHSNFTYRPFTLEGNFAFAAGLQEMLLQSHTGTIEVFPALPKDWRNCAFTRLRAQGAFLVSAELRDGNMARLEICSEKGGHCRVLVPTGGEARERDMQPGETWDVLATN